MNYIGMSCIHKTRYKIINARGVMDYNDLQEREFGEVNNYWFAEKPRVCALGFSSFMVT